MAIRIKAEILHEVCEKVIRGLEYYIAKRYVEGPFELKVFFVQETSASNLGVAFGESPLYLGPGFRVQRLPAHDDPKQVLYQIKVWDTLLVHGSIVAVQPKT